MAGPRRSLAAIMFTDIAGYTRLSQANESLALELLGEHRRVVRAVLKGHGGTEVKTIGDAFLVEFRSALDAVLCAVEIQSEMAKRNSAAPEPRRLLVRVGVHLGDVVHEGGDVYGDAVNLASRIEPLAEDGGVCISQQVFDHIRNKTELSFESMGEVDLKNVELPVRVYRVNLSSNKQETGRVRPPKERLAVLPFVNISPDPNDEYFADGLTEELISRLSEVKGLKVIARTSVMNYKKKDKSVSQIGRELEAGSIIEGSVRKAGNRIRVTVQLIDSGTEEHLWASNYDKELDDIFAIQSDLAAKVAGSVSAGLFPGPQKADTQDLEAYTLYVKAMQLFHDETEQAQRQAAALFEGAIARDPKFARAHAGLAVVLLRLAVGGREDFTQAASRAEQEARRALDEDPSSAEGHAAMASVANILDRFDQVISEAEEAVRINPNHSEAYLALGVVHSCMGRLKPGLEYLEKAYELDPLSIVAADLLSRTSWVAGNVGRAREVLAKMDEVNPMNPMILCGLAECSMVEKDWAKALELLKKGLQISPNEPSLKLNEGVLYALTGRNEEAKAILAQVEGFRTEAARLYGRIFVNAALGNLDEAFQALDRSTELHSWPFLIRNLPLFVELRNDPRYLEFEKKVGLRGR